MDAETFAARFWARVDRGIDADCWEWTGTTRQNGYGCLTREGRNVRAHRVAYELERGPIPDGLVLDHLCRNRACCNPAHLEAVTQQVNILRGVGAGARNAQKTHCDRGHELSGDNLILSRSWRECRACQKQPRTASERTTRHASGEKHPAAKLNYQQAKTLRRLREEEGYSTPRLAREFGIAKSTAYNICVGQRWREA